MLGLVISNRIIDELTCEELEHVEHDRPHCFTSDYIRRTGIEEARAWEIWFGLRAGLGYTREVRS